VGIIVFILVLLWIRKVNPTNERNIRTYYSPGDLKRKEYCPNCGIKMRKKWLKKEMGLGEFFVAEGKEFEAIPIFICNKCGLTKK